MKKFWWILYLLVIVILGVSPYSGLIVSMMLLVLLFIMLCFLVMFRGKSKLIKKLDPESVNYRFQVNTSQGLRWMPIVLMIFPVVFFIMGAYFLVIISGEGSQLQLKPLINFEKPMLVSWICSIGSTPIFILSLIGYFKLTYGYATDIPKRKK